MEIQIEEGGKDVNLPKPFRSIAPDIVFIGSQKVEIIQNVV